MNTTPAGLQKIEGKPSRMNVFAWAIALATGLDYFDNAMFGFFTRYIAGGINASPDELVWASTMYAMTSVLGILQQQWWVERAGYRRYVSGSLLLFAAGSVASALSESSMELAVARGLQGYFIAPMMSACRIQLQVSFNPQQRPAAMQVFLVMILLASALAPLSGGYLIAHFGWRALFAGTALGGAALALFAWFAVPHSGKVHSEARGDAHFWPYILFASGLGALLIVMQQVRFEVFSASPALVLLSVAGLLALAWFVWHQWHHPRPLVRLHALREKTFQVGIVLYMLFYYLSHSMGYLVSRLLEGGLGYPVENAGQLVGVTSLLSLPLAFAYFRYASLVQHKKWMIAPGFLLAALIGGWMGHMPPGASVSWLVLPLVLRGMLLLFVALPVANVTFRIFAVEEFNHGYRFKNIVKQLTYSFATATMIILDQHRFALHDSRLAEFVNPFDAIYQATRDRMVHAFESTGHTSNEAASLALHEIGRMVTQQASFLSTLDGFYFVTWVAVCGGIFAMWQRRID
ncbi:MFS transporter [Cupriavidus sp. SS-3]|uniref:MFS transporter n=1 Tax=Cupriavidus sp. SS-3 TaxID=3109596 RepID=UPI002DB786E9|nr:MFS transporter [Cupriavidus sp. SS-3]MEC3768796.1 MFS transporter [Cupriavidus sp. SS-3]